MSEGLRVHLVRRRTLATLTGRAFLLAVDGFARSVGAARTLICVPERTGRGGRPPLVWPEGFARAQVVKAGVHRSEGIVRRVVVGTEATVAAARAARHGGTTITTADIERLKATLRDSLAPLVRPRRTPAQGTAVIEDALPLRRVAYNGCWPHASLRLRAIGTGQRVQERTRALAAGLATRPSPRADLLQMPAPPLPLTTPRVPRRGRPSARGRVLSFSRPAAPPERSTA